MPSKKKAVTVNFIEGDSGNHIQIQFFDPSTHDYQVRGPYSRFDILRTSRDNTQTIIGYIDTGGLPATVAVAELKPGDAGFTLLDMKESGSYQLLVIPYEA